MELEVESQKRSHPGSDSVDSVDDNSFAAPEAPPPPPRSSKKKPAVVVSPGTARPIAVAVTAAAVGPLGARLLPLVPPRLAPMLCRLLLVMCRSLPGALVALKASNRGDSYPLKWLCQLSS